MPLNEQEFNQLLNQAREELGKLPGVVSVGFGYREKGGKTTDTLAFRVYVEEKKAKEDLKPEEMIPAEYGGYPTDVIRIPEITSKACEDATIYNPAVGGICISSLKPDAGGANSMGTIGFFATINGNTDNTKNVVLVSNNHVLGAHGAANGDVVYQPYRELTAGVANIVNYVGDNAVQKHDPIGKIKNVGAELNHPYAYPSSASVGYWVDAGTATVDLSISSWCNTNCGQRFKPEIRSLALGGSNKVAGYVRVSAATLAALAPGTFYNVVKVGFRTGRTEGKIVDVAGSGTVDGNPANNLIVVEATSANCNGDMKFAIEGDSGSPVVNSNRELVGLFFGGSNNDAQSWICHIHPVLDYLNVTPITEAVPHEFASTLSDEPATLQMDTLSQLKARFRALPQGDEMYRLIEDYRFEVSELVNHCRPVTVAWQRGKGPAFLNRIMANARNPEVGIPLAIDGVTLVDLVDRMEPALMENGSPELQNVLSAWSVTVRRYAAGLSSLHTLVDQLNLQPEHE